MDLSGKVKPIRNAVPTAQISVNAQFSAVVVGWPGRSYFPIQDRSVPAPKPRIHKGA